MKPLAIIAVLAIAIGLVVWLCLGSSAPPAKPGAKPGTSATSPSSGIVDAITVQLDAKTKAVGLEITSTSNDLKQTLARDPLDGEAARGQLKSYDDLVTRVASAREELATRGTAASDIDAWLTRYHWAETQELAKSLRDRVASLPQQ